MATNLMILAALQVNTRVPRRIIHPKRVDAFNLPDDKFISSFRLTKQLVVNLTEELRPYIEPRSCITTAISSETKVLCALRFYATGSDQRVIGDDCKLSMSQQTVSRVLREVTESLNHLLTKYVRFPDDRRTQEMLKREFYDYCGLGGVIGAIDCTHVALLTPSSDGFHLEKSYVNRKHFHSLNVQLVSDMKQKILNVAARYPGSCHDSYIWRNCNLRRHFDYGGLIKGCGWLLGDSGYPREPWLKPPIASPSSANEVDFNARHSRGRAVIERVNGTLKSRFRCLKKVRTLHYQPSMAGKIVNACTILHNICVENNLEWVEDELSDDDLPFNTGDGTA